MDRRGPGRPRETSHDAIRAIALRLFVEQGYAATSLRQIADAAGISRTTLFSYFPAKRDLLWADHDAGLARMDDALSRAGDVPLVDLVVDAMLAYAPLRAGDRTTAAQEMRIARSDDELRAFTALTVESLTARLVDAARRRAPSADPGLVDLVAHAVMAVGARCTDEWVLLADPGEDLAEYTARRLRPIVDALRPLLP